MKLRIVDRFSLSTLRAGNGAVLHVTPLTRTDAKRLAMGAEIVRAAPYNANRIATDLQLREIDPFMLDIGEAVIVAEVIAWNHINYFLVEFHCDLDGLVETDPLEI